MSVARRVALTGMLFALSLVLGLLESFLTPMLGLPPGVKPGLANIVVMYALLFLSVPQALLLVLLKAGFSFIARGGTAGLLSLAGGLLSLAVMALLLRIPLKGNEERRDGASVLVISIAGAIAHNLGQLAVFGILFGRYAWIYLPILLASGVGMGLLTAVLLRALIPALRWTGLTKSAASDVEKAKKRQSRDDLPQ